MSSLAIYFYAGDFVDAWGNYVRGLPQAYASHDQLMAMVERLADGGTDVSVVSFITEAPRREVVRPGVEIVHLGADDYSTRRLLRRSVREASSDLVVAHFPNEELLRAAVRSNARVLAVLATSYNERSLRARIRRLPLLRLLNDERVEFVANHCEPSTQQLRELGVHADKLIPWNVGISTDPSQFPPRELADASERGLFYAGAVTRDKGVPDLIEAVGVLRDRGHRVRLRVAGGGETDLMQRIITDRGLESEVDLIGPISNERVVSEMRSADLVVVPSRHVFPEGLPFTLFEALAARTPVVCSDHPVFEYFVDGCSASTFRERDVDGLADAIERPLTDGELYHRLSVAATATWERLGRTVDLPTLIERWVADDPGSPWLRKRTLAALG